MIYVWCFSSKSFCHNHTSNQKMKQNDKKFGTFDLHFSNLILEILFHLSKIKFPLKSNDHGQILDKMAHSGIFCMCCWCASVPKQPGWKESMLKCFQFCHLRGCLWSMQANICYWKPQWCFARSLLQPVTLSLENGCIYYVITDIAYLYVHWYI